jgi:predicted ester cyclase
MRRLNVVVIVTLSVALFVGAIGLSSPAATRHAYAAQSNKDIFAQAIQEGFDQGNLDALDQIYTSDYVNHGPNGNATRDQFKQSIAGLRTAMPDLTAHIDILIGAVSVTAARVTLRGTFTNGLQGPNGTVAPTNKPVVLPFISIAKFNSHGQIVEEWMEFDNMSFLRQFGVLPGQGGASTTPEAASQATLGATVQPKGNHGVVFQRLIDQALKQGDLNVMDELLSPTYVSHNADGSTNSLADLKASIAAWRAAMPDFSVTVGPQVVEGEWLAAHLTYTGTFTNELVLLNGTKVPPTGRQVTWTSNVIQRYDQNEMIVEEWNATDQLHLLTQLGLAPGQTTSSGGSGPAMSTPVPTTAP